MTTETKTPAAPAAAAEEARSRRKTLEGRVLSDAMDKTRVIQIERRFRHSLYSKVLTRHTKVYAHDETNDSKKGDRVSLMETRPLSKLKRWRVVQVLQRASVGQNVSPDAPK
jgi:small subunit ribosomal protein S17